MLCHAYFSIQHSEEIQYLRKLTLWRLLGSSVFLFLRNFANNSYLLVTFWITSQFEVFQV